MVSIKKEMFEPTAAQRAAINACGGGITVSAAAGSGKTRVLVQRVIRILTGENAVPADKLLILTFTNTAAAEMKTRIAKAIDELIEEFPDNDFYRRQQLLLSSADICTIDSFCSKIVRENFFRLGISRDFRIGSSSELYELRRKIMSDLIEKYYTCPEENEHDYDEKKKLYDSFRILSMLITDAKLDSDLESELLTAYDKYTAHAFPDQWIDKCVNMYDPECDVDKSELSDRLMELLKPSVKRLRECYDSALEYYEITDQTRQEKQNSKKAKDAGKKNAYDCAMDAYDSYGYFLENAEQLFVDGSGISEAASLIGEFEKIPIRYGASKDENIKAAASLLGEFADTVKAELMPYCCFTKDIVRENNTQLYPVMCCLRTLLKEFSEKFFAAKTERGILDFHDLESLVLKLLYEYDDNTGEYVRTDFAGELSEKYYEIMVDEYQDTNDIQEKIFIAISKNEENLFVVGDIKQSIFRFREAKPVLFRDRCGKSTEYDEADQKFPALIVLDKNFRSRRGIIDSVNYIFRLLMSVESGEIEYDEKQRLSAGADYPETKAVNTELHMIEYKKNTADEDNEEDDDEEDADKTQTEAVYCAGLIKNMLRKGEQVYDPREKRMRPAVYGDFCILLRAVKNRAHVFSNELDRAGIPSYTDTEFDLLERYEIKAALAYLKVLSNPLSDIDLTAAMMCPVSGFTPDELAFIRGVNGKSLYKRLLYLCTKEGSAENPELSGKIKRFVGNMRSLRALSVTVTTDRLLQEFFERSAFVSVMNAMPDGEFRVQNLRRLMNYISEYESGTAGGLTGFVRHIRYLEETGNGIRIADSAPLNAVKIMTIHHSKGLEFPICIIACTNSRGLEEHPRVNYHSELGIGLRAIDEEKLLQFNTLQYTAIKLMSAREEKSELLRVLYVALTRPKEKLIILSTVTVDGQKEEDDKPDQYRKYLNDLAKKISYDEGTGHIAPESVMKCRTFSDWIVMCALLSGQLHELRKDAGIAGDSCGDFPGTEIELPALKCDSQWSYVHITDPVRENVRQKPEAAASADIGFEKLLHERFKESISDITSTIPSKVSASALAHRKNEFDYTAVAVPYFAKSEKVSPAERGTATHAFLQFADIHTLYEEIKNTGRFDKEKDRLVSQQLMSGHQAEMINDEQILQFSKSDIFKKMLNAENLYREYRFTVNIPARLTLPEEQSDKLIDDSITTVLQGAVDCIIEQKDNISIIDYKTDRVKDSAELADKYGLQLRLYKEAASQLFDKPVTECLIYSLHCGNTVGVDFDRSVQS